MLDMNNSERASKFSRYDSFLEKYGNFMNFNDAKPLLEKGGIKPSKKIYNTRVWHDMIKRGRRQQEKQ